MALVACTQLKELDLRYTDLRGEWFVVGIDRGPVPSEQRMEQARCNTPGFLIFDAIVIFSGSVPRGSFFRGLWRFLELFFAVFGFTFHLLCALRVSDKEELRSVLGPQCNTSL